MPCLFSSSKDLVGIRWLHEVLMLNTRLSSPPEVELLVSGIVDVSEAPVTLRFVHRGRIGDPANRTSEWLQAVSDGDWISAVLNDRRLTSYSVKPVSGDKLSLDIQYRANSLPVRVAVNADDVHVSAATVRSVNIEGEADEPLYSLFDVTFDRKGCQAFRYGFVTNYGVESRSDLQLEVDVYGPIRAFNKLLEQVAEGVLYRGYPIEILHELKDLFQKRIDHDYDILVVPHARHSPIVEAYDQAPVPVSTSLDLSTLPADLVAQPCSPARILSFDTARPDFFIRIVCQLDLRVASYSRGVLEAERNWLDGGLYQGGEQ